jgi:hypothetical protein
LALLAGCTAPTNPAGWPQPSARAYCLVPSEEPMLIAELFFGLAVKGRAPLSEAEWAAFAARILTPNFPDGFTVFDGEGQWRNPGTGEIGRQHTKILLVAVRPGSDLADRLSAVIAAYKAEFHQQSVGLITREACAAF